MATTKRFTLKDGNAPASIKQMIYIGHLIGGDTRKVKGLTDITMGMATKIIKALKAGNDIKVGKYVFSPGMFANSNSGNAKVVKVVKGKTTKATKTAKNVVVDDVDDDDNDADEIVGLRQDLASLTKTVNKLVKSLAGVA
jgi:hypothetical protein